MTKNNLPENIPTYNKRTLKMHVSELLKKAPHKNFNYKQIASKLNITDSGTKHLINTVLDELQEEGVLDSVSRGKYTYKIQTDDIVGKVQLTASGSAFIITDDLDEDIFVPAKNTMRANQSDIVKVKIYKSNLRKSKNPEGKIVEILERGKKTFVGIVNKSKTFAFLEITERRVPFDIFITPKNLNGAQEGQKAIAEIIKFNSGKKNPEGKIIEVLGDPNDNEVEMHAILAEYNLPYRYPKNVIAEAKKIKDEISAKEIKKRKDFRAVPTFTIDPVDAKDFDDALSFRKLKDGLFEVGVHIADVSHYVKEGSLLDEEALSRATSIYLPDRTIPMLPERLSNKICSLRPDEEKLTYSAVFHIDEKANVKKEWFGRTVIKSDRRFSYEQAQEIIDNGEGDYAPEIEQLQRLAVILRDNRFSKGSIGFERTEVRFVLDEDGKPVDLVFKQSKEAHKLIEEFMLLANKKVATFINGHKNGKYAGSFVYRVHDEPDMEKLFNFSKFITRFGYNYKFKSFGQVSRKLNNLLKEVRGSDLQDVIELMAVQSMAKAHYSSKNIGHYGLSFDNYTHFTSPIRRYPDLIVHRLLTEYLENKPAVDKNELEETLKYCSEREKLSVNAERAAIKYKQVEYLYDKLGSDFNGTVIGVNENGLFVRIDENQIEGMLPARDIEGDYYYFDEEKYCMVGKRSSKRYCIGDKLIVKLVRADLLKRQLDFMLVGRQ
ncbi:MAG: ribonuclease R [Bacteroidota bacterium]|nr:ribonuclease R [Bacteroidota bacterium]